MDKAKSNFANIYERYFERESRRLRVEGRELCTAERDIQVKDTGIRIYRVSRRETWRESEKDTARERGMEGKEKGRETWSEIERVRET